MEQGTFHLKLTKQKYTIIEDPNFEVDNCFNLVGKESIYKAFMAIPDSPITEYNAFELYSQGEKIYLEFSALNVNNESELLSFVNKYGLLHSETDESQERKDFAFDSAINIINVLIKDGYNEINKGILDLQKKMSIMTYKTAQPPVFRENIDYFISEVKKMKTLMHLKQAFDENNIEDMKSNCMTISDLPGMSYIKNKFMNFGNDCYLFRPIVGGIIPDIINPNLSHAFPIMIYDSEKNDFSSVKGWSCNSLLTAMYIMIFLDYAQGKRNLKCENLTCNNWFPVYANDNRKKYCCPQCAQAMASRKYRERNSQ